MVSRNQLERLREVADKSPLGGADEILQCLRFALQRRASVSRILTECDKLLGGYGIEYIAEGGATYASRADGSDILAAYVNLGDTYASTIVYDYRKQRFYVTSWGDWYESSGEADRNRDY